MQKLSQTSIAALRSIYIGEAKHVLKWSGCINPKTAQALVIRGLATCHVRSPAPSTSRRMHQKKYPEIIFLTVDGENLCKELFPGLK